MLLQRKLMLLRQVPKKAINYKLSTQYTNVANHCLNFSINMQKCCDFMLFKFIHRTIIWTIIVARRTFPCRKINKWSTSLHVTNGDNTPSNVNRLLMISDTWKSRLNESVNCKDDRQQQRFRFCSSSDCSSLFHEQTHKEKKTNQKWNSLNSSLHKVILITKRIRKCQTTDRVPSMMDGYILNSIDVHFHYKSELCKN